MPLTQRCHWHECMCICAFTLSCVIKGCVFHVLSRAVYFMCYQGLCISCVVKGCVFHVLSRAVYFMCYQGLCISCVIKGCVSFKLINVSLVPMFASCMSCTHQKTAVCTCGTCCISALFSYPCIQECVCLSHPCGRDTGDWSSYVGMICPCM